ncbi:hypothetical protein LguiA_009380 [Lonicera macranthoides]
MAILSIAILFFSFPCMLVSATIDEKMKSFKVPSGGPESFIFARDVGFYTGVNDGRVVYDKGNNNFIDFTYASPKRTKALCDGTTDPAKGNICGRILGIGYYNKTDQFYLADAYYGLCVVGPQGGLATQVLASAGGVPLKWLDGIDVDQTTGKVYFTDVSTKYDLSQVQEHISTGDSTGRLIEYDPKTKKDRVLLSGLKGAGGVGVSKDGSFVLVSEFTGSRITKYWLSGPKADTAELLLKISGPANIKRTEKGDFWVALNIQLRHLNTTKNRPTGVRMDENGNIVEIVPFGGQLYDGSYITEVHEHHKGTLYVASIYVGFGGLYTM